MEPLMLAADEDKSPSGALYVAAYAFKPHKFDG